MTIFILIKKGSVIVMMIIFTVIIKRVIFMIISITSLKATNSAAASAHTAIT